MPDRSVPRRPIRPAHHGSDQPGEPAHGHRIVTLTDGVFAIALTLLVLDIRVPAGLNGPQLMDALRAARPALFVYALSFAVIGVFWLGHHRMFDRLARVDNVVIRLNLFLLGMIALVPFPTTLVAEYDQYPISVVFYAATITAGAAIQTATWLYASGKGRLLASDVDPHDVSLITIRSVISVVVFAASIPLAFVSPHLAEYSWISLAVLRGASRFFARRFPRPA